MAILAPIYVLSLAVTAGFSSGDAVTMTAIALSESGGNTDATKTYPDKSTRSGVFMIPKKTSNALNDGKAALAQKNASGFQSWQSYKDGTYKGKVAVAQAAQKQLQESAAAMTGPNGGPPQLPAGTTREQAAATAFAGFALAGSNIAGGVGAAVDTAGDVLETALPAAVDGLTDAIGLANIGGVLNAFYELFRWFTVPANLWRLGKFIMGMAMIFVGGMAIIKDTPVGQVAAKATKAAVLKKV